MALELCINRSMPLMFVKVGEACVMMRCCKVCLSERWSVVLPCSGSREALETDYRLEVNRRGVIGGMRATTKPRLLRLSSLSFPIASLSSHSRPTTQTHTHLRTCLANQERSPAMLRLNNPDPPRLVYSSPSVVFTECYERVTTLSVLVPVLQVSLLVTSTSKSLCLT